MDGDAFKEIPGISSVHINDAEGRSIGGNLNIEGPAATGAASEAGSSTPISIQRLYGESLTAAGAIAATCMRYIADV